LKKRTAELLELARRDHKVGLSVLEEHPNIAAFHAQQCAEKALKAVLVELSDVHTEKDLREKIRHNSIMAVMGTLAQNVRETARQSGLSNLENTLRSARTEKKPGAALAWVLYLTFSSAFAEFFTLFQSPPVKITTEIWKESLDPQLLPNPSADPAWKIKRDSIEDTLATAWEVMWSTLSVESIPSFSKLSSNPTDAKVDLQKMALELEIKGQGDSAASVRAAIERIDFVVNPQKNILPWITLAVGWAPYLDAHASTPRYATEEELRFYWSHKDGVRNLLAKAKEIMDATPEIMKIFPHAG
jgi:HEPN domain-containing protein